MRRPKFVLVILGIVALVVNLLFAFREPISLRYHYSRMVKLRRSELQKASGNDLHQRYVHHRDLLVRAGYKIEQKRISFTNVDAPVLHVALKKNFPDLDFEMPTRGGRVECVVVYGSSLVTRATQQFIIEHDVRP